MIKDSQQVCPQPQTPSPISSVRGVRFGIGARLTTFQTPTAPSSIPLNCESSRLKSTGPRGGFFFVVWRGVWEVCWRGEAGREGAREGASPEEVDMARRRERKKRV